MKKVLTILMSVLMLTALATTSVLADEPTAATTTSGTASTSGTDSLSGQETFDVKANITKSGGTLDDETVYDVVIEWEMVPAEYTSAGDTYHWNPSTLKYERTGTAASTITKTSDAKVSIKVINNSNAAIKYDIAYASASGKHTEEVNATGSSSGKLESAAPASPTLTGSPDASEAGASTSGTYKADVAFSSTSGVYTDTFATGGPVTMGTYTVKVNSISKGTLNTVVLSTQGMIDRLSGLYLYESDENGDIVENSGFNMLDSEVKPDEENDTYTWDSIQVKSNYVVLLLTPNGNLDWIGNPEVTSGANSSSALSGDKLTSLPNYEDNRSYAALVEIDGNSISFSFVAEVG